MDQAGETARETAQETPPPAVPAPALRVPGHGRGRLLNAGVPGNAGGSGAPPSALRARLRGSFADRIAIIEEIADDASLRPGDRVRAIDLLARYSLGEQRGVDVEEVRAKLRSTVEAIRQLVPSEAASPLLERLREIWAA